MSAEHTHDVTGQVVLGTAAGAAPVDSTTAERWGLAYAARRGLPVTLLGSFDYDVAPLHVDAMYVAGMSPELLDEGRRASEEQLRRRRTELLADTSDQVEVQCVAVPGHPGATLVEASQTAALVVLGTRGLDGLSGLLLGSTSQYTVTHARGPVAVVSHTLAEDLADDDPVVVGIDGRSDHAATAFAFREASREGRPLVAVHSWGRGDHHDHHGDEPSDAHLDGVMREALAPYAERYPDVRVLPQIVKGESDLALLGASARAAMLVVGTRGRGEVRSVLFGSTSMRLVGRATCPVVVVPEAARIRRP